MVALARTVQLTPPAPPGGGLLAHALPLPAGWERGITFSTHGCTRPFTVGPCPTDPDLKQPQRPAGSGTFMPVTIGMALECSSLGGGPSPDAGTGLDATLDYALVFELATAAASTRDRDGTLPVGNVSLAAAHSLGDGADPVAALAALETAALSAGAGRPITLFTTPAGATYLKDEGLLWRDGTTWRTVNGSPLIVSVALHDAGIVPHGVTTAPLWATGPVYAAAGHRDMLTATDRTVNTVTVRAEDLAMVAFDPCVLFGVGLGKPEPVSYTPPGDVCVGIGTAGWVAVESQPSGDGELQLTHNSIKVNEIDNADADQTAALAALKTGDVIRAVGQDGHVTMTLTGPGTHTNSVFVFDGTATTAGVPPSGSEGVQLCVEAAPAPAAPACSAGWTNIGPFNYLADPNADVAAGEVQASVANHGLLLAKIDAEGTDVAATLAGLAVDGSVDLSIVGPAGYIKAGLAGADTSESAYVVFDVEPAGFAWTGTEPGAGERVAVCTAPNGTVHNPPAAPPPDDEPDPDPAPPPDEDACPPATGPGSGLQAWQDYFTAMWPDVDIAGLSRDDLVALHDTLTGDG